MATDPNRRHGDQVGNALRSAIVALAILLPAGVAHAGGACMTCEMSSGSCVCLYYFELADAPCQAELGAGAQQQCCANGCGVGNVVPGEIDCVARGECVRVEEHDAGMTPIDAGMRDAGMGDAGMRDAGSAPFDGGSDAGPPVMDGGCRCQAAASRSNVALVLLGWAAVGLGSRHARRRRVPVVRVLAPAHRDRQPRR